MPSIPRNPAKYRETKSGAEVTPPHAEHGRGHQTGAAAPTTPDPVPGGDAATTALRRVLLSNLPVQYPSGCSGATCTGWPGILAGTALGGVPLQNISVLQHVDFVMKDGKVFKRGGQVVGWSDATVP